MSLSMFLFGQVSAAALVPGSAVLPGTKCMSPQRTVLRTKALQSDCDTLRKDGATLSSASGPTSFFHTACGEGGSQQRTIAAYVEGKVIRAEIKG